MEEKLFERLEEILEMETGTITKSTKLPEDLWDSLTILSVSAAIDSIYDKVIPVKKLGKCSKVQDIINLVLDVEQ